MQFETLKKSTITIKSTDKFTIKQIGNSKGYDGHCLRAHAYFGDQMPDIDLSVDSINSIETKYPDLRQLSKTPTFLLTYRGTYHGLMNSLGLSEDVAKQIEKNYHDLYKVSDDWVNQKLTQATIDGYVTVAFGLRVRTPILGQTILNTSTTPYAATKESRTAGNALGQSYGLLNNRAAIEFQERCMASEHRYKIHPIAHVHDSQYFFIKRDLDVLKWVNDNLVECMEWQGLPEIQHPKVKLGGNLEVFYPNWAKKYTLHNKATIEELKQATTIKKESK